jgi:hypothetical protein
MTTSPGFTLLFAVASSCWFFTTIVSAKEIKLANSEH